MEPTLQAIFDSIIEGDAGSISAQVTAALEAGIPPARILTEAMIAAMAEIGRGFEEGEYFVPEMLIAARAMKTGLAVLKPHLIEADVPAAGKVIAGTVQGDLHDIGKNLVCMMFEGAGFEVVDLGTDVAPERFVEAVRTESPQIVAMSALLTTTMINMRATIEALEAAGLRSKVKVMVGGAPITENFAQQIGADGFAPDASRAVAVAKALVA